MKNQLIYRNLKGTSGGTSGDDAPSYPGDIYPVEETTVPDELLRSSSGKLIYSNILLLWAQFVFSQSGENLFPSVSVNNERCSEHSSSHIIAVEVSKTSGTFSIKMSMRSSGKNCKWNGSASCTYRVWGGSKAYSEQRGHGKSKSGTCSSGASFIVRIENDDYSIV